LQGGVPGEGGVPGKPGTYGVAGIRADHAFVHPYPDTGPAAPHKPGTRIDIPVDAGLAPHAFLHALPNRAAPGKPTPPRVFFAWRRAGQARHLRCVAGIRADHAFVHPCSDTGPAAPHEPGACMAYRPVDAGLAPHAFLHTFPHRAVPGETIPHRVLFAWHRAGQARHLRCGGHPS